MFDFLWSRSLTIARTAKLDRAELNGVRADDADFALASLIGTSFRMSSCVSTSFAGADLRDADISGANLLGADFSYADLSGANLSGAFCEGVSWKETICPSGEPALSKGCCCDGTYESVDDLKTTGSCID